jgi:hypothetical protein
METHAPKYQECYELNKVFKGDKGDEGDKGDKGDEDDEDAKRREYYEYIDNIECNGDKCRVHASAGFGYHCISCFGEITEDDWTPLPSYNTKINYKIIIYCNGEKCRLFAAGGTSDKSGIFCYSCNSD